MGEAEAAFHAFGVGRRMVEDSEHEVEALTPLLARAEGLELRPALRGALDGRPVMIGLLRYEGGHVVGADGGGMFEFVVAITRIAESVACVPRLFCRRRGRIESTGGMGMALDAERVWTESEALGARYEVSTSPYQDRNWMLQLFSPDFIDWLVTAPSDGFAFELAYGDLVASIPAAGLTEADLAALWACTAVLADRIRRECREGGG